MSPSDPSGQDREPPDQRLAKLARMIPGVIYQYRLYPDGRSCFPYASPGLKSVYGVDPEQVREDASVVFGRLHPDDLESVQESIERSARELSIWRADYRAVLPDGSTVWLSGLAEPERLEDGSVLWHGYIREVTEEKESAERLRLSEALYRAIFDNANDAIFLHPFDADAKGCFREVNQRACDLLGYSRARLTSLRPGMLEDPAHMPDIPAIARQLEQRRHAMFESVLVASDQRRIPVEISSHLFDLEGVPHILSLVRDITERREAERLLRLNATVFESSREGIVITDRDNHILAVNSAYCRITGYDREEVLGRNPKLVSSGREPPEVYRAMWAAIQSQGFWQGELINRRKDGREYPQALSVSVVRDASGAVSHYIGMLRDLSEAREIEAKIERLSHYDVLTGLPNRDLFRDRLAVQVRAASKQGAVFALLCVGLDRFKFVNDSLGTATGDEVLVEMGRRLAALLRPTDTVSRQGGDEFAILLPETDTEGAAHVARKLLLDLARPVSAKNQPLTVTGSIGVAVFPEDGTSGEELLTSADAALNRSKESGRNTYEFFTSQLQERARRVLEVENDLRSALAEDQLELFYQPKVDLSDGRIIGAEALVRWNHPRHGLMLPGRFIPVAEETDLIIHVGHWVLQRALCQLADWARAGLQTVPVAVNVSAREFGQPDLPDRVREGLARHDVAPDLLELEITESMAMGGSARTLELLQKLRAVGVALSIDDFGTGYSSLSYLKQFSVDYLKIDQSFVRFLDADNRAIVRAMIGLANGLGVPTIAEGIETREQLLFLTDLHCPMGQGYYFSRPVPAADFARLLATQAPFAELVSSR